LDVLDSFALAKFGYQKGYYMQAEDWFKMIEIFYLFAFSKPLEVMGFNFAQAWQLYARNLLDMSKYLFYTLVIILYFLYFEVVFLSFQIKKFPP